MTPAMRALPWTAALATGLEVVDRQHQRLLDIFNEAVASRSDGATRDQQADALLASLVDYTQYHFREEAQLMRSWAVDPAHQNVHLREHAQFIRFLDQTRSMADRYPQDSVRDALTVLTQWLVFHIMLMDKQMANEVRRRQWQPVVRSVAAGVDRGSSQQQPDASFSQLSEALSFYTFENLDQKRQLLDLQSLYRALLRSAEILIHRRSEADMLQGLCDTLVSDASFHAVWIGKPGTALAFDVLALAGDGAQQVHDAVPHLGDGPEVSVVTRAWKTERVVVCNDTVADESLRPWHEGFRRNQWMALLAVPVFRSGTIWATLALISHVAGVFDRDTIALCTSAAELLGRGLDELDLRERLVEQESREAHRARHDALTGLPNRLALLQELPQAIARAQRHGTQLAVGMIDLDDFKPVNDTWGHQAGDQLLREIARRLTGALRHHDLAVRLGGDEFVVVVENLPGGEQSPAFPALLERIHKSLTAPFVLGDGISTRVGISMGVAFFPEDGTTPDTLLRTADTLLGQLKEKKNDRSRWWATVREGLTGERESREEELPFGGEVRRLLAKHSSLIEESIRDFVRDFYKTLPENPEAAEVLSHLSPQERDHLARGQEAYLKQILSPEIGKDSVVSSSRKIGEIHFLTGVTSGLLIEATSLYRRLLAAHLRRSLLYDRERRILLDAADRRIEIHVATEIRTQSDMHSLYLAAALAWGSPGLSTDDGARRILALPGIAGLALTNNGAGEGNAIHAWGEVPEGIEEIVGREHSHLPIDTALSLAHQEPKEARATIRSALSLYSREGDSLRRLLLFGEYPNQFASQAMHQFSLVLHSRLPLTPKTP